MSIRVGLQYGTATGTYYRVGLALEETPQPGSTVGPFLADANRTLFAMGFGKDPIDVAFVWVDAEQRIISNQIDDLNGSYRSSAWKLALTLNL